MGSPGWTRRSLGSGFGWIGTNTRDLRRIALAVEKVAEELARIRAALEDKDEKEDGR